MTNFHYPLPESEPTSPWSGLSDEARTALTKVAMGPSAANLLLSPDGSAIPELDSSFQAIATTAHQKTTDLLTVTQSGLLVPELGSSELAVDWRRLQSGYEVLERLDLQPELVISPEGQPLSFWQRLYSGLRQWQDENQPDATHRLLHQDDGDGLYVNEQVQSHWDELTKPDQPRWGVSVIPTTVKSPVLNVSHKGTSDGVTVPNELTTLLTDLGSFNSSSRLLLLHPTMERYLALQANRIKAGQPLPDDKVDGLYYWSWLDGRFKNSDNNEVAPRGDFYSALGQVRLVWSKVGLRDDYLGVRPEVRG